MMSILIDDVNLFWSGSEELQAFCLHLNGINPLYQVFFFFLNYSKEYTFLGYHDFKDNHGKLDHTYTVYLGNKQTETPY